MRVEGRVFSVSWIPSEAVTGGARLAFDAGFTHYDDPPPDEIGDLEVLRSADGFRFANVLDAWADFDGSGQVIAAGYGAGGLMGATTVRLGAVGIHFQAARLPDLQREPSRGAGWARFSQTTGGRTGLPAPRRVSHRPFVQWQAPLVWTTLSMTLHADGRAETALTGASPFPRHWVYSAAGALTHKSGLTDFSDWYRTSFGRHSPWGAEDSPALVTAVESALERELSTHLMRGVVKPHIQRLAPGQVLVQQGSPGTDVYLILDGVIRVERDGEPLAEYGPGAILGERAHLEDGTRTSSLIAVTEGRVASLHASHFDHAQLTKLADSHRREHQSQN